MDSNDLENTVDFDISSYSIADLYDFLGVNNSASLSYIKTICDDKKCFAEKLDQRTKQKLCVFIDDCYKMISSLYKDQKDNSNVLTRPSIPNVIEAPTTNNYAINPITPKEIKQVISIDSLFRDNFETTKSTDFVFTLPTELNNVTTMKLTAS